jgi:hypothetical protein
MGEDPLATTLATARSLTWVCPSSTHGLISIPDPGHYGSGQVQGLDKIDLETKKGNSNLYSTRTLVNPSMVAYIKPGRGALREISHRHRTS